MFTRRYSDSALVMRNDLRSFLKASVSFSIRRFSGRLFHNFGPARENALRPYSELNFFSTSCRVREFANVIISFKDSGAKPQTHLWTIRHTLNTMRSRTFNQCKDSYKGVREVRSNLDFPQTILTAAFCTDCSMFSSLVLMW